MPSVFYYLYNEMEIFVQQNSRQLLSKRKKQGDQTVLLLGAGLSRPSPRREELLEGDDENVPLGREKYEPSRGDGGHTVEWQQGPVWQWKSRWTISGSLQENL